MTRADLRTIMSFGVAIDIDGPEVVANEVARLLPDCDTEIPAVDRDGRVHPYPRNLRIRAEDLSTRTAAPDEFTDRVGRDTLPLTHIALLRYESDKAIEVEPVGGASAALALVDNTVRAVSTLKRP